MRLYVTPTSPYARLAMIVRLEKGLDGIELVWTRTRVPDDPMLAFNPSGRIPFLRLDDGTGFEDTDVIVDFIDTLAPPCRFAPPWGEAYWPFRRRRAAARSMLDGVSVWAREIIRPEGERSPAIIDHERRRAHAPRGCLRGGDRNTRLGRARSTCRSCCCSARSTSSGVCRNSAGAPAGRASPPGTQGWPRCRR